MLAVLTLCASVAASQENPLSITSEADTLMARLIRSPQSASLDRQLINEYIRTLNPELALVEVSYAEKLNLLGGSAFELKGKIQASLEHIQPALENLKRAYLQSPNDDVLLIIGILEYARGNESVGRNVVRRIMGRSPGLSVDLLNQYEKYYLNGREIVARAISSLLHDLDPASFTTFFPAPSVTILSPSGKLVTEAPQVSVIFEVRHVRPLQDVLLKNQSLFDRGSEPVRSVSEDVSTSYTQMVDLTEGRNLIPITVTDVFGITTVDSLSIDRISFERRASWQSPLQDSLEAGFRALRGYVPDRALTAGKKVGYRALILAGGPGTQATGYTDKGLFLHRLFTDPYSGFAAEDEAKLLLGDRVTAANFSLVADEWLLKGTTFQSTTVLYLCGNWSVKPDRWELSGASGEPMDVKPVLERLSRVASAGILLLWDGSIDDRQELENGLARWADASTVPITAAVLGERSQWPEQLIDTMTVPPAEPTAEADLSLSAIAVLSGSRVVGRGQPVIPLVQSPARKVAAEHARLFAQLGKKIASERVSAQAKAAILEFCSDWRRYSEVERYVEGQLSIEDLAARADEFRSRNR